MERIRLIVNSMLLDIMGSVALLSEGVLQIQNVLLEKLRDRFREFAKGVASEIATSHATTDREKAEIKRIMRRMESPADVWPTEAEALKILEVLDKMKVLAVGEEEEEVGKVLTELERLSLVEEVPPPDSVLPACESCVNLMVDSKLSYCDHDDAEGVAGTTENTGYVTGVQPRKQPSWCPRLPKSEKDPPVTENSSDSLDPSEKQEE